MVDRAKHSQYAKQYKRYKAGYLPNAGGTLDQPYKFWKIMETIEAALLQIEEDEKETPK